MSTLTLILLLVRVLCIFAQCLRNTSYYFSGRGFLFSVLRISAKLKYYFANGCGFLCTVFKRNIAFISLLVEVFCVLCRVLP